MLTPRQVADQMSLKEYLAICAYFDSLKQQETQPTVIASVYGDGSQYQTVLARTATAHFDVLEIDRQADSLIITAEDEHGVIHRIDAQGARTDLATGKKAA